MVHSGRFLGPILDTFRTFFGVPVDVSAKTWTFKKHYKNQWNCNNFEVARAPFLDIFYEKRLPGTDLFRGRLLDPVLDQIWTKKAPKMDPRSGQEEDRARQKSSQKSDPKTERKWTKNGTQHVSKMDPKWNQKRIQLPTLS